MSINTVKKDLRVILGLITGIIPVVAPICSIIVVIMKKQYQYVLFPIIVLAFTLYFFQYKSVNTYEIREDLKESIKERILAMEFDAGLMKIDDVLNRKAIINNNIYGKIYSEISDLIDLGPWNRDGRKEFREFIESFSHIFDSYTSSEKEVIYTENKTIKITPKAYKSHSFYLDRACNEYVDMQYPPTWMDNWGLLIFIALWVGMLSYSLFVFMRLF